MLSLDPKTTALVLIDLQKGILANTLAPYSSADLVKNAKLLAERFRKANAPVVLVNVGFSKDGGNMLKQPVDQPNVPPVGGYPENFSELVDDLAQPRDICITKHQWGAFHGTSLDDQLRRRGITTIVLGGVATNIGVESTARQAWERGYAVVFVEDATTGLAAEMHAFAFKNIFPRIGRTIKTADVSV